YRGVACNRHVVLGVDGNQILKLFVVMLLAHEALDHPDAVDRLRQRSGQPTVGLLHVTVPLPEPRSEIAHHHPKQRHDGAYDEKQQHIVIQHEVGCDQHRSELHRAHEHDILNTNAYDVHVRCHTTDQAAQRHFVEKTQRLPQQVRVDLAAHVEDHRFTQ